TASQTAEVILACGGVVQLLKHLTGRESPFTATTPTGRWDFFPNQIEYAKHVPHFDAFPSGHIATAMATLQVIIENYPEKAWIKYVGYPIIGSIAVGLVSTSIHWWSDIPLGVVLGYTFGRLVAHPESDLAPAQSANEFRPELNFSVLGNGSPAMGFSLRW
ncbi:MAG: phosphatase PAP2 family protein, partial [Bacteroidota bacterium]|nr:phosphatase PAP2 family protein [Bacteroidota bacterium]